MSSASAARMKAVLLTGHGGPEKLEYREDVPVPVPAADEVLIRVGAAAINNTDIWTREGAYNITGKGGEKQGWRGVPLAFPRIQGIDVAGRIVAVGRGVAADRVGERILLDPVLRLPGDRLYGAAIFGSERDGGFAEFLTAPAANAVPIHSTLGDAELAALPSVFATALHMLNRATLAAGERVIVTGASGGVGTALVQLAKLRGATVLAVVGRGKEAQARALGADLVIARDAEDLADAVRDAWEGQEADLLADVVGGDAFAPLLATLKPETGRCVVAGAIGGPLVEIDLRVIYLRHLTMIGSTIGTRAEFLELAALIEAGRLKPLVSRTYPLADIRSAQEDFVAKRFFGKLVLLP